MTLHTIAPEHLPVEHLWAKVRAYYADIKPRREYQSGYSDLNIFSQLADNHEGSMYGVAIIDDYDYEEFIGFSAPTLRSALIGIISRIEFYIDTTPIAPEMEDEEDDDY